ncbi:hypothetical protein DNTS_001900, partial [Danionella cerebrum]
ISPCSYKNPPRPLLYKYPPHTCPRSHRTTRQHTQTTPSSKRRFKNFQEDQPKPIARQTQREKKQDLSPYIYELSDLADLFPGNEGEMTRDWDPNPAKAPAFFTPLEQVNVQPANNHRRKTKDNRRRLTVPLDRIGSSHLSSRSRKEEPEDFKSYEV